MEFQAETKKLLDIVANSLYTDKEVFVRELVSNASDALEKRRYEMLTAGADSDSGGGAEMGITITTDKDANTLTIADSGIGMTKEELVQNLGTIARSGTKAFAQGLAEQGSGGDAAANVIGQFGVGFYAVFMVAEQVTVFSRRHGDGEIAHCWTSTGDGAYDLSEAENVEAGTKIVLKLKESEEQYASRFHIEQNIRKYSNFVGFPITVDGERINTIEALWLKSKQEVTDEQHNEFFRYVAQSFDDPRYTLHFAADAPVSIRALFYVPQSHMEKWGMARQDSGVHLYSRKVLIQSRCETLLPEWMRFLKGVVDSEDLPLNISRESMQDSALMRKLSTVLAKRVVKFLVERAKVDHDAYLTFYQEFGQFIKEGKQQQKHRQSKAAHTDTSTLTPSPLSPHSGIYTDFDNKHDVAKLLRFESSRGEPGELMSLDDYVGRMVPEQNDEIYWLLAPTRDSALSSAYMEAFKAKGVEVLLLYSTVDEFVMTNLMSYGGKSLVSAEAAKLDLDGEDKAGLSEEDATKLREWMVTAVDGVKDVKLSTRLTDSPAIVVGHESASMRRMMTMVESGKAPPLPPQTLEINGSHPIITSLHTARDANPPIASKVANQLFTNALVQAGLLDDPRTMLPNVNELMVEVLSPYAKAGGGAGGEAKAEEPTAPTGGEEAK